MYEDIKSSILQFHNLDDDVIDAILQFALSYLFFLFWVYFKADDPDDDPVRMAKSGKNYRKKNAYQHING